MARVAGCACAAALCFAMPGRAHADGAEDEAEQVRVEASRAGGFTSQARIEDAPREVTDAASLVEPLAGVHVRRFGGDDSFATMSVRGTSSTQVAVVLAGVPLTGGSDPSLDLSTLPLWPGVRVRVYRSFAPAALGQGSLGGTLALEPPRPASPTRTEVWAAAGAFGARRLRIGDVRAIGDAGARVVTAVSASRSDDDFSYFDPLASGAAGDAYATRTNAGHVAVNGLAAVTIPVKWSATSRGALTITTLAQARRQRLPGTLKAPTPRSELASNRLLVAAELEGPAGEGAWTLRAWGRRDGLDARNGTSGALVWLGPTASHDAILAAGGSAALTARAVKDVRVDLRLDGSGEQYAPGLWVGAAPPAAATRGAAGGGIDAEALLAKGFTASATGRADVWHDSAVAGVLARTELRPTGHVGAEVRVGPVALIAHGGVLARPPGFVERFGNRGAFIGDPTLRPESARTVDAGVRAALRAGALRLSLEAVAFGSWANDLIVFVYAGAYGRARATNIGRASTLGAELEATARLERAELRASYTLLDARNATLCAARGGLQGAEIPCERPLLPGRPRHDLVLDASYGLGPVRLRYGVDVVSGMTADLAGTVQVPARVLQSAGARVDVPFAPGLRIAVDARNLFDVRTATYDGVLGPVREPIGDAFEYPLPGRSVLVSARFTR